MDLADTMSWLPVPCTSSYPEVFVLCEQRAAYMSTSLNNTKIMKKENLTCSAGYIYINGSCLCILSSHSAIKYESAARLCTSIGGVLALEDKTRLTLYHWLLYYSLHQPSYGGLWVNNLFMLYPNISNIAIPDKTDSYTLRYSFGIHAHFNVLCQQKLQMTDYECGRGLYTCMDGSCILHHTLCDGVADCNQAEDESECPNRVHHFICSNNQHISPLMYCDSMVDCTDESDEIHCSLLCEEYDQDGNAIYKCSTVKSEISSNTHQASGFIQYEFNIEDSWYVHPIANVSFTYKFCPAQDEVRCNKEYQLCIPRHKVCIYETDIQGNMLYCPKGEHLHHCETFQCPHMYKCPESYCIQYHSVCNGVKDCVDGDDEIGCDTQVICPGLFKCHGESVCVDQRFRCGGKVQCPMFGSDEHQCEDISIPTGCFYEAGSLTCTQANFSFSNIDLPSHIRVVDLSNNNMESLPDTKINTPFLMQLLLNHNKLMFIPSGFFYPLGRLLELDLSHNKLTELQNGSFHGLSRLQTLKLAGNPLSNIHQGAFNGLQTLRILNLTNLKLSTIQGGAFLGMPALSRLLLQNNYLKYLVSNTFIGLVSLEHLDVSSNPLDNIDPEALANLKVKTLHTDEYIYCCFPMYVGNCTSKPAIFSSCADLMDNEILRISIWFLSIIALVGNLVIIFWRSYKHRNAADTVFAINLAISDLLMGVYLIIIASVDVIYRDKYARYDHQWRQSNLCRFAGVLSTVSGLLSNIMLACITYERLRVTVWPISHKKYTNKQKELACLFAWILVVFLSSVPVMKIGYFGNQFIKNGVCLLFNMSDSFYKGWEFMTILLLFNLTICLFMLISYLVIVHVVRKSRKSSGRTKSDEDSALTGNVFKLVVTNSSCWLPVIMTSILSLCGVPIHPQVAAWMIVFALPLNSAINPYLYSRLMDFKCMLRSNKKKKKTSN